MYSQAAASRELYVTFFSFLLISLHAIHYACVIHCGFFSKVFFIIIADKCWSQSVESSPPGIYNSRYKELVNIVVQSLFFSPRKFYMEPLSKREQRRFHVESRWNGPREIGRELIGPSSLEHASKKRARSHEASNKIQTLFAVSTIGSTAGRRLEMEEGVGGIGTGASNRNCSLRHFNDPKRGREKRRVAITVDAFTFSSTRS